MWARGRCRISLARFLAECCKRQLNQVSFVVLYFRLSTFSDLYWVCLSVFSCTVLFVSISQVIGCEDRLRNDLYCVEWVVKLYSNQPTRTIHVTNDGEMGHGKIDLRRSRPTVLAEYVCYSTAGGEWWSYVRSSCSCTYVNVGFCAPSIAMSLRHCWFLKICLLRL